MTDKGAGYMQQALLDQLRKITEEERKILDGEAECVHTHVLCIFRHTGIIL